MQRIFTVFLLLSINTYGQTIQLNEIVSSNASVIYDEDGDTPDWIELHNPSNQAVNLDGFGLRSPTATNFKTSSSVTTLSMGPISSPNSMS